jgi:hypothetical protein
MAVKVMIMFFWVGTLCRFASVKMEIICFSEMVLSTYVSTWHKNPELQQKVIQFEA